MTWKAFTLGLLWLVISLYWILLCSVQDKEWWIGEDGIKNICDLMSYIENDDTRDVGIFFSLPVFFPVIYISFIKQKKYWFIYVISALISVYWLWQFFIRYQLCLW